MHRQLDDYANTGRLNLVPLIHKVGFVPDQNYNDITASFTANLLNPFYSVNE